MARILVIGLGNILMQDEGVGVRVAELLESRYHIPDVVEVIDGGTTGTELYQPMRGRERLIVTDCVNTGAPPGTLVRLADDEVPAFFQTKISNHQLGLSDLLALLAVSGDAPRHVTIVGMVPYELNNTLGLSAATLARIEEMLQMVVDELAAAGVILIPREAPLPCFWDSKTREGEPLCA
jgi:hydrogenase maturation protease